MVEIIINKNESRNTRNEGEEREGQEQQEHPQHSIQEHSEQDSVPQPQQDLDQHSVLQVEQLQHEIHEGEQSEIEAEESIQQANNIPYQAYLPTKDYSAGTKSLTSHPSSACLNPFYHNESKTLITPKVLISIMESSKEDGLMKLQNFYSLVGLANSLHINLDYGIQSMNEKDLKKRKNIFGTNYVESPKPDTFLQLMLDAFEDLTVIVLTCAGFLSLLLGLWFGKNKETDWIEGFSVLLAVMIVVLVTAINDYQKEKQFRALNSIKEDEKIKVIRDGECKEISKYDILVGDIVRIELGDILPADGILFDDKDVKVDESSMTGESVLVTKNQIENPFLLSGTKVMEGIGKMLVLCVGENSQAGMITTLIQNKENKTSDSKDDDKEDKRQISKRNKKDKLASADREDMTKCDIIVEQPKGSNYVSIVTPAAKESSEKLESSENVEIPQSNNRQKNGRKKSSKAKEPTSPLQGKLNKLTIIIGKVGTLTALTVFIVMCVRFSIQKFAIQKAEWEGGFASIYLNYFITAITVLVVAIPEGLPLAVTIALAYSVRKMLKDNNLIRHLDACETMGSATTICSDKTGTLTRNRMTVMKLWSGNKEFSPRPLNGEMLSCSKDILCEGICINSTAEVMPPKKSGGEAEHMGSKTECALLQLAEDMGYNYRNIRRSAVIEQMTPFNSTRKRMSVIVKLPNTYRLYVKGATEVILELCTHYLSLDGETLPLTQEMKKDLNRNIIMEYANTGMRTLCLAYRNISQEESDPSMASEINLICVGIVGIEDPVRPEVPGAIEMCKKAGIIVRMVTGDNINTARSIAKKCGIIEHNDKFLIMEGTEFRERVVDKLTNKLNQQEFDKIWPQLRILARSSPRDKYLLVTGIMKSNLPLHGPQVVAVTGDGTNDAPALKRANVGFAMGISGTSVAKDASDIILMDDNFTSIVNAVKWGRNVYDNISKFLQFQITVNIVAISVAVIGAISIDESPLSAVQLLWVNLIMNTFASLALATERPCEELLLRKPYSRTKAVISKSMTKHIVGQAIYQLIVLLNMVYQGENMFNLENARKKSGLGMHIVPSEHYTMVFNTFVLMQLFNEYNCRKIHDEVNIFSGLLSNYLFLGISAFQFLAQALIVNFGERVFHTKPLNGSQWCICLGFGLMSLPIGAILRFVHSSKLPRSMAFIRDALPISYLSNWNANFFWMRGTRRMRHQFEYIERIEHRENEANYDSSVASTPMNWYRSSRQSRQTRREYEL